MPPYHYIKET